MWSGVMMAWSDVVCSCVSEVPGRSCLVHERRALSEKSYWPAYSPSSTCLNCNHTSETQNHKQQCPWWEHTQQYFPTLLHKYECVTAPEERGQGSHLVVHQEFWTFEVSWGHSDVVLLGRVVKLCQTPVYKAQLRKKKQFSFIQLKQEFWEQVLNSSMLDKVGNWEQTGQRSWTLCDLSHDSDWLLSLC